jgi:aminoglycoside phosphotransferase (APT) family kinase protein
VPPVNVWDAEFALDAAAAHALLAGQFPDLALDSVEPLGIGFDNTVYLVDGTWVFRFPRREVAVPLMDRELAVLPGLAPRLPLPVPVPELIGKPADGYPWPFWGGRLVPGVELAEARLPEASRDTLAVQVGEFLRALHDPVVAQELGGTLPHDPMRRGTPSTRGPMAREALDRLAARGSWDSTSALDRQIDDVIAAADPLPAPTGQPVLVHGDLHVRHLMVGPDGLATGVIDWGDCCLADPALDLSLAYAAFSGPARAALLTAYDRPVDEERELRARLLGLWLCAALADYADIEGFPALLRESLAGLRRAVS